MQVTLESTTKIVELIINDVAVPARIWEGVTAKGIKCHAYITRIAVHQEDDATEFEAELKEQLTEHIKSKHREAIKVSEA